ncbi:MAG TPA: hypothetical protein PKE26_03680 [Kiritimatiellia bacterium]|nr:hypothetical protein [Kiritimatiellia bacterium]HMO98191.1 hypothetical protein [Kiritimatiellia bacterium]HMP96491.1 hypothetical protein [Kiritimatiellia bacterium]
MATEKSDTATSQYMLLFELEGAALNGRAKLFEATREVFQEAGLALNERQFARHCVHAAPAYVTERVIAELGGGKLGDEAAARILAGYTTRMQHDAASLHPNFVAVLDEAARRGIRATALTVLPEDIARNIMDKTGLAARQVDVMFFPENERHFPRTDCWLKVPRSLSKAARACIAIAGTRDSGKSAVSAGMRCLVIPDTFTAYQDFGGVDAVLDSLDDIVLSELLDALT